MSATASVLTGPRIDDRKGPSLAEKFMAKSPEEQRRLSASWSEADRIKLKYTWEFWARPNQLLPPGTDWQTWLIRAGRGYGKTRTGAETVKIWIQHNSIVNIIAPTADDARDVCIEGPAGILAICSNRERPEYQKSNRKLVWPNGSTTLIFTADEPERLRGKQHMKLWCDELAAWRYISEAWDQAMFGLRLGDAPQAVVTTTPKPLKEIKELSESPTTFLTRGTTYENRRNLAAKFFAQIITKYEGTRLGRQELNAELLEDRLGALWTLTQIDADRIKNPEKFWREIHSTLIRVVGGIDPAVTSNEESDEWGVVYAGRDEQVPPHFYVFEDRSEIYTPDAAAKAAVAGYHQYNCDRLVAEVNNGGDMIEALLRHVDQNVSYRALHASRGKITRAEPISALYEQHRVHHVGMFGALEDQMCDYDPATASFSPDRMDALVWALTELSEGLDDLGVLDYFRDEGGGSMAQQDLTAMENFRDVGKTELARTLAKPVVADQTPGCPKCECVLIQDVPGGGQKRCQNCGHQWWPDGKKPDAYLGPNRSNIGDLKK